MKIRLHRGQRSNAALGPNATLVGEADSRSRLVTPSLILDLDTLEHNMRLMSDYCRRHGTMLRPHAKSHKSVQIAKLQARYGAVGICAATLREAEAMVMAGVRGVLLTSPIVGGAKLAALQRLLRLDNSVTVVVDSVIGAKALDSAFRRTQSGVRVLIDVDVGMKRTGVPTVRGALKLARQVNASHSLELVGVQCYSGMVQHIESYGERAKQYGEELGLLESILDAFNREQLSTRIVSGGGTGTFDIDRKRGLFTESQAGSYVFMDVQYNEVHLTRGDSIPFKTALFVQSMVLSNNHRMSATVDAGLKSFATDGPAPLIHSGAPVGAQFQYSGDEFGWLTWTGKRKHLPLGSKVELVTPHCDPTVNLHNYYHCVRRNRLVDIWPIDARGSI